MWSGYPVQEGDALNNLALVNQIHEAILERYHAFEIITSPSGAAADPAIWLSVMESGANYQSTDQAELSGIKIPDSLGWMRCQRTLEYNIIRDDEGGPNIVGPYVRDIKDSPIANSEDYPSGFASVSGNIRYSVDDWRRVSQIPESGFTRKHPNTIASTGDSGTLGDRAYIEGVVFPPFKGSDVYEYDGSIWVIAENQLQGPSILTSYGHALEGDYIGPWLLNEMHSGLKTIKWICRSGSQLASGIVRQMENSISNSASGWTYSVSVAKNEYNNVFDAASTDLVPRSYWVYNNDDSAVRTSISNVLSEAVNYRQILPSGASCDAEVYIFLSSPSPTAGATTSGIYDASDLIGGTTAETYNLLSQESNIKDFYEVTLGDVDTTPVEPPKPSGSYPFQFSYSYGYATSSPYDGSPGTDTAMLVYKYDGVSGFKYI